MFPNGRPSAHPFSSLPTQESTQSQTRVTVTNNNGDAKQAKVDGKQGEVLLQVESFVPTPGLMNAATPTPYTEGPHTHKTCTQCHIEKVKVGRVTVRLLKGFCCGLAQHGPAVRKRKIVALKTKRKLKKKSKTKRRKAKTNCEDYKNYVKLSN